MIGSRPLSGLRSACVAIAGLALLTTGCAGPDIDREALSRYYEREPRTIVVLPVENRTTEAEAPRFFLATISHPLIDRGYYVYPPHLVQEILVREGIDPSSAPHSIDARRLHDYLGADAALFVTIDEWDTTYAVLSSAVSVAMSYRLVDTRTGDVLWERQGRRVVSPQGGVSAGGGAAGLVAGLVSSAVNAAVHAASTPYAPIARRVNRETMAQLPVGSFHEEYAKLRDRLRSAEDDADRSNPSN